MSVIHPLLKIYRLNIFLVLLIFCQNSKIVKAVNNEIPDYLYPPVNVSATSLSELVSQFLFSEHILKETDIQKLPVQNVTGLFQFIPGVQAQSRGYSHVQTDLSLRGSSFEQVTVYVDGIPVNDPQTGHHHADLPVPVSDIERIEIITGPAAAVLGASNIGGIVHIHTKKAYGQETRLSLSHGMHNTSHIQLGQSFQTGSVWHRIKSEAGRSDGYRFDSDYKTYTVAYSNYLPLQNHELRGYVGYSNKAFGANNFYADFPSFEKTKAVIGTINGRFTLSEKSQLRASVYQKWHDDDFILDFENPQLYHARHQTFTRGLNLQSYHHVFAKTVFAFSTEIREELLQSHEMGDHSNEMYSLSAEFVSRLADKWLLHSSLKSMFSDQYGKLINPSFQIGYYLSENVTFRISSGRVFRTPSFTERYYHSPANIGDPNLKPETGWIHEVTLALAKHYLTVEPAIFFRQEYNRVEWIRYRASDPWKAVNFKQASVSGVEIRFRSHHLPVTLYGSMTGLLNQSSFYQKAETKYPFNTLNLQALTACMWHMPCGLYQTLIMRYSDYKDFDSYLIFDTTISRDIKHGRVFLELTNIFNTDYEEIRGLPMPGFAWLVGFQYHLEQ